jgi:cyanophycinase
MRPRSLFLGCTLALAACASPASEPGAPAPAIAPQPSGHLVIVGGGGTPDRVVARAIELAGGGAARAVVLPQASSRAEAGEESVAYWKEKGLANVVSLDLADPAAARSAIEAAEFIWFPGGDQSRLLAAIDAAGLREAIRARYWAGAVVGGTSAGAAVMSPRMIVGGETADLEVVRAGSVELVEGLGLLPGTIVDQHFLRRQRFNRLLSAVLEHPDLVGIGIDEKTAIVVTGTTFEVLGESGVLVLDARGAQPLVAATGAPTAADGLRAALLREGMAYDLAGTRPDICFPPAGDR